MQASFGWICKASGRISGGLCFDQAHLRGVKVMKTKLFDSVPAGLMQLGELADHGVIIVDHQGRVVYYNPWQANLDQLDDPDLILGKPVDEKGLITRQTSILRQVLQTGKPVLDFEQHYMNFKNQYRKVHGCAYPVHHENELVGAMGIYRHADASLKVSSVIRTPETQDVSPSRQSKNDENTLFCFADILGEDVGFLNEISMAQQAARGDLSVLICGETGTGKELVAQSIHCASPYAKGPFIAVNCAAIPESLFESTLFGTCRNAFTGAVNKKGLMALAHNGTLFLDEINSMPLMHQSKLLRAVETGRIRPVGSLEEISIRVRVVSSCNADPGLAVGAGTFRRDLFYRLAGFMIQLPALKDRREDIILLANTFMERANRRMGRMACGISVKLLQVLMGYDWPGNVRQLKHYMESNMALLSPSETMLTHQFLPDYFNVFSSVNDEKNRSAAKHGESSATEVPSGAGIPSGTGKAFTPDAEMNLAEKEKNTSVFQEIRDAEKKEMLFALKQCRGNITKASQQLNISRRTFYYRMKKHGIEK